MIIVITTVPEGKGKETAKIILEKRLAACINIIKCNSLYWWENKIEEGKEEMLIIKTRKEYYDLLEEEIKKIHPYKVPEIICLIVKDVNKEYYDWLIHETSKKR